MMAPPEVAYLTFDQNDKDDVLLSILDLLDEIAACLAVTANPTSHLNEVAELKKHSSDLLCYVYKHNDGDNMYLSVPKSPYDLAHSRTRMLAEVEEDVTYMRGYLCGLEATRHVSVLDEFLLSLNLWNNELGLICCADTIDYLGGAY
jgi:hypothetical protein